MRNVNASIRRFKLQRVIPYIIVVLFLIFAASASFTISPQNPLFQIQNGPHSVSTNFISEIALESNKENENPPSPTATTALASPTPKPTVSTNNKQASPPTANQTNTPQNNTSSTATYDDSSSDTSYQSAQSAPSAAPLPPSPTSTPVAVVSIVNVDIKTPDSSSSFSVEFKDGMNVCDVLQKAKDDGKISSLTIDDSYLSTLNSKYVYEINGYKNNWTFTVNGNSPLGCSLSNPKPNDIIVWKFL